MFKKILEHHNLHLLITLGLFLLAMPFIGDSQGSRMLGTIFLSLILLFGVLAAGSNRRISMQALILGIIALIVGWLDVSSVSTKTIIVTKILYMAFFIDIAFILLARIMKVKKVTSDTICGAACVYILIGLSWAFVYAMVEFTVPGSFSMPDVEESVRAVSLQHDKLFDFLYYSFVTITTLGYGDIVPVRKMAKMLSILESLVGQLFIALLVARLVGLYTAQQHMENLKKLEGKNPK